MVFFFYHSNIKYYEDYPCATIKGSGLNTSPYEAVPSKCWSKSMEKSQNLE